MSGIRHGSGVSLFQAFVWNLGTCLFEDLIAQAGRGGRVRSSVEVDESSWSKGTLLISGYYGTTRSGKNP